MVSGSSRFTAERMERELPLTLLPLQKILLKWTNKFLMTLREPVLKPIRWKTFPRDFVVIQIGFALFGLSIAMLIRASLGTSPWVMLEVALSQITSLTPGTLSVIVGFVILLASLSLRERIGWGTLANIVFIGPWEDLALSKIPAVTNNFPVQLGMLLAAALMMGMASAIYIGVDAGAGPRDSLMLAVKRISGWSLRRGRAGIEIFVVLAGWLLGGPIGIGTVIFALIIGASVQFWFRVFKVEPHRPRRDVKPTGTIDS